MIKKNWSHQWKKIMILVFLSFVVASSTVWALRINGESWTGETWCGLEEHQHDDTCVEKVLVCGYDTEDTDSESISALSSDGTAVSLNGDSSGTLSNLSEEAEDTETIAHVHTDACYEEQNVLICTEAEHTHSEDAGCYEMQSTLTCTEAEHTHSEENGCYETQTALVCTETEHTHSEENGCYDEEGNLICETPEHIPIARNVNAGRHIQKASLFTAVKLLK